MNIHEAAEIVRDKSNALRSSSNANRYIEACDLIESTFLSELDPTPISEDWLEENGWELTSKGRDWLKGNAVLWRRDIVCWDTTFAIFTIKTLGELRTLLRMMGGE